MSLRVQQILVFVGTVLLIFGLFAAGIFLVAKRLTTEATLQTALLLARQVEIALAQSLTQPPPAPPQPPAQSSAPPRESQRSSFWDFLGRLYPGNAPQPENAPTKAAPAAPAASRRTQVQ